MQVAAAAGDQMMASGHGQPVMPGRFLEDGRMPHFHAVKRRTVQDLLHKGRILDFSRMGQDCDSAGLMDQCRRFERRQFDLPQIAGLPLPDERIEHSFHIGK